MRTILACFLLSVCAVSAQTYLRVSNAVQAVYFTNDDAVVIYRGTNAPMVLRGSNLITTLRQFFLTNAADFVPAGMSNVFLISLNGAQPTNNFLTQISVHGALTNVAEITNLANATFAGNLRSGGTVYAPILWVNTGSGSWNVETVVAAATNRTETKQNGTENGTNWATLNTNVLSGKLATTFSPGSILASHPITGQAVPAGGEYLWLTEPFKLWGASAWPAQNPLVISGLSAYSYKPIWREDIHQERGGLWLWVTNWPGRITYVYYADNTTASGSGSLVLRTNSWFDVKFWTMAGGASTAITNCERIVGLLDAPGLSAGAMPRDGAFFMSRPAGSGPLTDWAAVVMKGNAMVSSNRLGWGPSTNEWQRLTIAGSSNSLTFYTNGVAAVTVNSLTFQTNALFPVPMYLRTVVTNTGYTFASNSVWIDWLQVKE